MEVVRVMVSEAEVVIIGSGAFGSSTAYHLAGLGRQGIVLVDAHEIGSQTSPRAAGLTKQVRPHPDVSRLAILSVAKILQFTAETGEPLTFVQSGSVNIARGEPDEAVIRAELAAGQALGLDTYEISYDEMTLAAPLIRPRDIRLIAYTPSDLYLEDPGQLALGYARAAERQGVTLLPNTRVTGIGVKDGRVINVTTAQGEIRTPAVVDAAGAWTRLIAEHVHVRVPLIPVRHQLYITERIPGLAADHAICRIYDAKVYMRPHQGGLLLGGYERDPHPHDMSGVPPEFQIQDLPLDMKVLERLVQPVQSQLSIEKDIPVREHRGGLPTMTPDGLPLIGPLPSIEGFYVASGCCVGGLSISPAVGEMLAELVHTGLPSLFLDAFSVTRFGPEYDSDPALREACLRQYTEWYSAIPPVSRPR
ncbi:MAG TPA: FAD-binding oxidoreductase [bacterium]|nr:FAD-binding oxidoreductase [bacterium]